MLSIIVASDREQVFASFKEGLAGTVGCDYELLRIDVSKGLCHAYNEGARQSRYPVLCFVHDDVFFHTQAWGPRVISHLQQPGTGLIGIAGGTYKSAAGLDWQDGGVATFRACLLDGKEGGKRFYYNPKEEQRSPVVCLDGVFLCCNKSTWQRYPLDEQAFTGFHFYDADWSMQTGRTLSNYVVYDIELEHFSTGTRDRSFLEASLLFERKWKKALPATIEALERKDLASKEGYALSNKLALMKKKGFSIAERKSLLLDYYKLYKNHYQLLRSLFFGFLKP